MIRDENQLFTYSVPLIQRIRESATLPDVPLVILSATTGTPADQREKWTSIHADLATTVPRGTHIVLADTGHAVNQERPDAIARAISQVITSIRSR
jgi:pimeloyl-ACP methyl ester carboxylesterase